MDPLVSVCAVAGVDADGVNAAINTQIVIAFRLRPQFACEAFGFHLIGAPP